jgi:hypothetical protein
MSSFQCSFPRIRIHLRVLSNGGHHPVARCSTIEHSRRDPEYFSCMSVNGSRLAVLTVGPEDEGILVIWDWKSGELLSVSQSVLCFCDGLTVSYVLM